MTKIIKDISLLRGELAGTCVTIGNFDGVHLGHQALISRLKKNSLKKNLTSVVITFDPHPLKVLLGNPPPFITPLQQKLELISQLAPDIIWIVEFNKRLSNLKPEQFIKEYLVDKLSLKLIVIGHDYRFGKGGKGDFRLLQKLGKELGFQVERVDAVVVNGDIVSSTRIRVLVQEGKIEEVRSFLGRFYEVRGTVVEGQKRGGPILGVPTANLRLVDELYPKTGVYAVFVKLEGNTLPAVANVGYNPTFGKNPISVEVHIFNFSDNIYGKKIRVQFVKRLRDERKFSSIEELKEQIHKDINRAMEELSRRI